MSDPTSDKPAIDKDAMDRMAVAPGGDAGDREHFAQDPRQRAGQDPSIDKRLQKNPESVDARLDAGIDESMDASDPPAATQPVHSTDPAPSSGFDADKEREIQEQRGQRPGD